MNDEKRIAIKLGPTRELESQLAKIVKEERKGKMRRRKWVDGLKKGEPIPITLTSARRDTLDATLLS